MKTTINHHYEPDINHQPVGTIESIGPHLQIKLPSTAKRQLLNVRGRRLRLGHLTW